ncbi:ABC transporter substrate-binding protein [Bradyrhizobium aeschynomenes]|uniref:ABC transporter substrate-binding protein n=1 Tax=Bradyrhizobium aeschynomenes TaxID=2734909 RepID=UPI001FF04A96|nr:ABC transporter substrate-binding protein [Bradyrhizobium aeschynomenes]
MPVISRRTALLGSLAATLPSPPVHAREDLTLDVMFPFPVGNNREIHVGLADRFMRINPEIKIKLRNPAQNYEEMSQQVLRAALIGQLPDLSFHGLNLLRLLVERDLAQPLAERISAAGGADLLGYAPAVLDIVRQRGDIYGIPFFISTPVLYVNEALVREVDGDPSLLPPDWSGLVALGQKINATSANRTGFYFQWDVTGNWMWQAMLFSRGGRILSDDERAAAFDSPEGLWALEQLEAFARSGMPNLKSAQARPALAAGTIGILADSSSNIAYAEQQIAGRFPLRVAPFPLVSPNGKVPAGGALGVIHAKDPRRADAAWKYLQFCTSPESQAFMARLTGYMPSNAKSITDPALLGAYYQQARNQKVSVDQLPVMTGWYAFPGANAVRIIETIRNHLEAVVTGRQGASQTLKQMAADVNRLIEAA